MDKLLRGEIQEAKYMTTGLSDYDHNPLILALPSIWDPKTAIKKIMYLPTYKEEEMELPMHLKLHCVQRLRSFVMPLNRHIELEQAISRTIRYGYTGRSIPNSKEWIEYLLKKDILNALNPCLSTASSFAIIGYSGIGKSTAIERILINYPQVIVHKIFEEIYLNHTQLVWLKLECPSNASARALCIHFFQAVDQILGTKYEDAYVRKRSTKEDLLDDVARVCYLHSLGMFVIDEIQRLNSAGSGGKNVLSDFLVKMVNTLGVPVIMIGTPEAMTGWERFSEARRAVGQGDFIWDRFSNKIESKPVENSTQNVDSGKKQESEWNKFIKKLWDYQWTRKKCSYDVKYCALMYDLTQGIIDIAIKLYMMSQWRAITADLDCVDETIITSTAKDSLRYVQKMLDELKDGKIDMHKYHRLSIDWSKVSEVFNDKSEDFGNLIDKLTFNDNVEDEIARWLIEGGIRDEKAEKAARDAVKENPNRSVRELRNRAFVLANEAPKKDKGEQKEINKPTIAFSEVAERMTIKQEKLV